MSIPSILHQVKGAVTLPTQIFIIIGFWLLGITNFFLGVWWILKSTANGLEWALGACFVQVTSSSLLGFV